MLVAATAAVLWPAAASAQPPPLSARSENDPWHLEFVDGRGKVVLSESRGTGSGPSGSLGFRTPAGWFHATRAVSTETAGRELRALLETTDPLGGRLRVRLSDAGQGAIRLEAAVEGASGVEAVGIGFDMPAGERFLGFGERSNAVDQAGNEVNNWVGEGAFQPEERPFAHALIPPAGYRPRDDATYFPMPWFVSTRGYGALVENLEESWHRLGSDRSDTWSVEAAGASLGLVVVPGPSPADVLRRFTATVGRQPAPLAPWFFGPWFQTGQENHVPLELERRYLDLLEGADAPVSVAETHRRYLPCGAHTLPGARDQERARTAFFHSRGLAVLSYFNPMICTEYAAAYDEAERRGVLARNGFGQPYNYPSYVGESQPPLTTVGQVDFSAPGAQQFFDEQLAQAVEDGHDGWMEDFGEYTPADTVPADESPPEEMHNRYPVLYHCAGFDFARRQARPIARFIRSGWTGVHPCAQVVWGGDPTTGWGFDGLASAVKNGLTMGLSGIGLWGSDIGGFHAFGFNALTPELLIRWIQFGAASPVMRTKADGFGIPDRVRPQIWEKEILPHWRRWAKLHTQLYPYLEGAFDVYRSGGMPIMRHLALTHPGDDRAAAVESAYMFGPDLLAAPVLEPGARERRVYMPAGRWIDLWRSAVFEQGSGRIRLRAARELRGPETVTLPAPLDELPLLVRAGAVLPLLPPDVDTLADYGRDAPAVSLTERRDRLDLLAFPRRLSGALVFAGEALVSDARRRGRWVLSVFGKRRRLYRLQASTAGLRPRPGSRRFRPRCVRARGRRLRRGRAWRFDRRAGVLTVRFRIRRGNLVVTQGRCHRR